MAKNKTKIVKEEKYRSEEQTEMLRFIRILLIVIVLIVGIYFLTRIFVTKDLLNKEEEKSPTPGVINYNVTLIGSLQNKPEEEYYVIIYDTENVRSIYYSGLITNYNQNEEPLKIYFANLNNEFNKKFYDPENEDLDVSNISDLKVGDISLLHIRNGAIIETWNTEEQIADELKYIKPEDA